MRKTKYIVKLTTQFKKDYRLAMKRGLKMKLLEDVVAALAMCWCLPCPAQESTVICLANGRYHGMGEILNAFFRKKALTPESRQLINV